MCISALNYSCGSVDLWLVLEPYISNAYSDLNRNCQDCQFC